MSKYIILDSGIKIFIPSYDNLKKIGSKEKLKEFLQNLENQDIYDMESLQEDMHISRIGRTYYVDDE